MLHLYIPFHQQYEDDKHGRNAPAKHIQHTGHRETEKCKVVLNKNAWIA